MKTRSQTSKAIYTVNIDFDEAATSWRTNKESIGNGSFKYVCTAIVGEKKKRCGIRCVPGNVLYCRRHSKEVAADQLA
jgi:hypothetical protein